MSFDYESVFCFKQFWMISALWISFIWYTGSNTEFISIDIYVCVVNKTENRKQENSMVLSLLHVNAILMN